MLQVTRVPFSQQTEAQPSCLGSKNLPVLRSVRYGRHIDRKAPVVRALVRLRVGDDLTGSGAPLRVQGRLTARGSVCFQASHPYPFRRQRGFKSPYCDF